MTLPRLFKKIHPAALMLGSGLVLGLTVVSCGNNGCEQNRESYLYADIKATSRFELKSINVWALTETGDSLKLSTSSPTSIEFNLKPDTTFSRFRLQCIYMDLDDAIMIDDTLTVNYQSYPYYLDMECGCSIFYDIEAVDVTRHLFKSISLENKEISNDEKTNIILKY